MAPVRRALLALIAGLGLASTAQAGASPRTAPESWLAYASLVGRTLPLWLEEPTEPAKRAHGRIEAAGRLPLRLWAARDGRIKRIEAGGAHADSNRDLEAVLVGRRLPEPPPAGLRWPIRLMLSTRTPTVSPPPPAKEGAGSAHGALPGES